ncbi:MAG: hypothetical protein M3Q48_00190 [Actinomycetota bacterium]|nr:hypothetical protein [Actinomycetota bacterium]
MVALFALASFVGAGLLFLVQLMVAKTVLPLYGGSPAVWNTAVQFFQAVLLGGYGYAHVTTRRLGLRRQPWVHLAALPVPLAVLPIKLPAWATPRDGTEPALWLLGVLIVAVGLPFLLVSTTGPLLQRWFAATDHPRASDPYFLYAAGNTGSLLALLAYPLAVEPALTLRQQATLWSLGYLVFAALIVACALALRRRGAPNEAAVASSNESDDVGARPVTGRRRAYWMALAFLPSSLMLGVTTYISTDIAAVPLLWVLPLSLYLLTFIVAFGRARPLSRTAGTSMLGGLVVVLALTMTGLVKLPTAATLALHLLVFVIVALVAHTRLAQDRPGPARLTEFYLLISVGGVLGGMFNGLVAPVVFTRLVEYPLVIAGALLLAVRRGTPGFLFRRYGRLGSVAEAVLPAGVLVIVLMTVRAPALERPLAVTLACVVAAAVIGWLAARRPTPVAVAVIGILALATLRPETSVLTDRTFFGLYRVFDDGDRRVLVHGVTVHGSQELSERRRREPQTYYARQGPAGRVFAAYGDQPVADRVAIVGLGTGALAAYGRPGQSMTIYEIDQAIVDIARDPGYFTYLSDTASEVDVVVGDGRLGLAATRDAAFGLMVFDAFSSDAIPVHLMTNGTVELYRRKLEPGGLLLFHISNRHLELEPVLAGIARRQGLAGMVSTDATGDPATGRTPSKWVVLAADPEMLDPLREQGGWEPVGRGDAVMWTDDFSDVVSVLAWR